MSENIEAKRQDRAALLTELKAAGAIVKGSAIACPFHDDAHPSGALYEADGGVWRFKCHAVCCGFCGDLYDVRAKARGGTVAEVLREARGAKKSKPHQVRVFPTVDDIRAAYGGNGRIEAIYRYHDPETKLIDRIVLRLREGDAKKFAQFSPTAGGYIAKAPPKPWGLYNRLRVMASDVVIVVEGEKCVHALHAVGMVATTNPCGAGKAEHTDWEPLAGRTVYLWPDNDEAGVEHMKEVAALLERLNPAPRVRWIDPAHLDLPANGDVADYLDGLKDCDVDTRRAALRDVLSDAESMGASREVRRLLDDTISGKRRAIPWPWGELTRLTRALLPGTLTLLCGDPDDGKSFMLIEAAAFWHRAGVRLALYELEEGRAYHLNRALAQAAEDSNLIDADWLAANPEAALAAWQAHADFLDRFGARLWLTPERQLTLDQLAGWIRDRARYGCRIVAVDPVTAVAAPERPWVSDSKFVSEVKSAAEKYRASVILVTHPKKGRKLSVGLDELAGGAAYSRFAQTIIWIERPPVPKEVEIVGSCGVFKTTINRIVHLGKTRNAFGHGTMLGFKFCGKSLRFAEQGPIRKE